MQQMPQCNSLAIEALFHNSFSGKPGCCERGHPPCIKSDELSSSASERGRVSPSSVHMHKTLNSHTTNKRCAVKQKHRDTIKFRKKARPGWIQRPHCFCWGPHPSDGNHNKITKGARISSLMTYLVRAHHPNDDQATPGCQTRHSCAEHVASH